MSDEPTLEAFAGGDDDGDGAGASGGGGAGDGEPAVSTDRPLAVTSAYQPDGECASCGASSARLWADGDGGRVCSGCATWTTTGGRAADQ